MRIVEIKTFGSGSMNLSAKDVQDSIEYFYGDFLEQRGISGQGEEVGKVGEHTAVKYEKGDDIYLFLVNSAGKVVFYVAASKFLDGYTIGNIRSAVKGLATAVYSFLLDQVPAIYSDAHQTAGGKAIWNKLAQNPKFRVTAVDVRTGKEWKTRPGEKTLSAQGTRLYDKIGPKDAENIRLKLVKR